MKNRKKLVSILAGVMAAVLVLTLILSLLPTRAYAASSSEIRKQITGLQEQRTEMKSKMKELESQYQENKDEISNIVAKKNLIDQEMTLLHAQVDNINEQITAYGVLVADKQDELDAAQENYNTLNEEYKTRIRTMEEEGTLSYWEVLFKANSFSDLLDRMSMIEEIAASDTRRLEALDEATKAVAQAPQELDATQAELDAKREEADGVIAELLEKAEEIEGLKEELESEDQDLLNQIAQMEKEYTAAKHQEWLAYMATYTTVPPATTAAPTTSGGSSGGSGNTGISTPTSGGTWLRPCSYTYMSSPFGFRTSPTAGASSYHQGVDLAAPANTPVYATRSGIVTANTYSGSAGNYITINHGDGFSSIYMHLANTVVSSGQAVSAGQLIGYVGRTGIATGYHLHFGIAYNGAYVNPCAYVSL